MDKNEIMKVIYKAEAAFIVMGLAAYVLVQYLDWVSEFLRFGAWLLFSIYVVEAVGGLVRAPRRWAGLIGLLLIFLVLIGIGNAAYGLLQIVAPLVVQAVQELIAEWPDIIAWVQRWSKANPWISTLLTDFLRQVQTSLTVDKVTGLMSKTMLFVSAWGGSLLSVLGSLLLAALMTPYKEKTVAYLSNKYPKTRAFEFDRIMNQYAVQRIVSALSLGLVTFLGNLLLLKSPLLALGLASFAFLLDFIPYLGPLVAFLINGAVVLVTGYGWFRMVLSLAIFLGGQTLEQLVAASLASMQFSIPLVLALVIVVLGGSVAGVPGLILGVPLSVYVIRLIKPSESHDSGY